LKDLKLRKKSISQLISEMGNTGYQGRKLAEIVDLWETLVKDDDLTIVLGLAGSMSTAGQWTLVNWLIKARFIDVIVSTGANVSEDIVDAIRLRYWQATSNINDEVLLEEDINRYYDIYRIETDYRKMEELVTEFLLTLKTDYLYSSMEILHMLGSWLIKKKIESICGSCREWRSYIQSCITWQCAYGETFLMAKKRRSQSDSGSDQRIRSVCEYRRKNEKYRCNIHWWRITERFYTTTCHLNLPQKYG
jgi:deoxyhypusine synthase